MEEGLGLFSLDAEDALIRERDGEAEADGPGICRPGVATVWMAVGMLLITVVVVVVLVVVTVALVVAIPRVSMVGNSSLLLLDQIAVGGCGAEALSSSSSSASGAEDVLPLAPVDVDWVGVSCSPAAVRARGDRNWSWDPMYDIDDTLLSVLPSFWLAMLLSVLSQTDIPYCSQNSGESKFKSPMKTTLLLATTMTANGDRNGGGGDGDDRHAA